MALTAGSESVALYYGERPIKQVTVGKTVVWQRTPGEKDRYENWFFFRSEMGYESRHHRSWWRGGGAQGDGAF